MTTPHDYNAVNLGHATGFCKHCGATPAELMAIGDINHCPDAAKAKEQPKIDALNFDPRPNSIIFNAEGEEMLRLSKQGFFVEGVQIKDPLDVYNRFAAWLSKAEKTQAERDGK